MCLRAEEAMGRHRWYVWFFCMFGIPLTRFAMQKVDVLFRDLLTTSDQPV